MITVCETKDAALLAQLNRHVHALHHQWQPAVFKPWNDEAVTAFFTETLARENCVAYLAMQQQEAIGYILLFAQHYPENAFAHERSTLLIDQVLVLPGHQQKGVGKMLMDKARQLAGQKNIHALELSHWQQNEKAARFFQGMGFEPYFHKLWLNI